MSTLEKIQKALESLGIPFAYADSDINRFPRIIVNLVSNTSIKLSNLRHTRKLRYQIDLYSEIPRDIEVDDTLYQIEQKLLENGLNTSDWFEVSDIDVEKERGLYRYMIEVFQ